MAGMLSIGSSPSSSGLLASPLFLSLLAWMIFTAYHPPSVLCNALTTVANEPRPSTCCKSYRLSKPVEAEAAVRLRKMYPLCRIRI